MRPLDTSAVITYYLLFERVVSIGVRAIFGGGWIDFARQIWGSARKK